LSDMPVPFAQAEYKGIALIDAASGRHLTYHELSGAVTARAAALGRERSLVFLFTRNTIDAVLWFLGARAASHPVALLDADLDDVLASALIERYRPHVVLGRPVTNKAYTKHADGGYRLPGRELPLHPRLGVLLSTSGSTGSPKFVRLSASNVESNASAIAESLGLTRAERAFAHLPLHYSYGMSILTSHLAAGASVVISDASVIEPRFWDQFRQFEATSLAGVPYTYQMLDRIGFLDMSLPSLTSMTQAGGKLSSRYVKKFHAALQRRGGSFFVMYGQTEASPRITCLPADDLPARPGSVGRPLAGGSLTIEGGTGQFLGSGVDGEIVYRGTNVMMGYAEQPEDLSLGDIQGNVLRTGDIGHVDEDGFLYITGRSKRIGKVFGLRVNLDDVEQMVVGIGQVAVVGAEDRLHVHHEHDDEGNALAARKRLSTLLRVPVQAITFHRLDAIPVLANGKPDYKALEARVAEGLK
jgi:acyl-CoA synthetase (AMP-forming)/AMP-acid ligase II